MQRLPFAGWAIVPAGVVWFFDAVAVITAWGPWRDRAALLGLTLATALAAAYAGALAVEAALARGRLARALGAAGPILLFGGALARTHSARAHLGLLALPIVAAGLAALLWVAGLAARRRGRLVDAAWLILGVACAGIDAALPRRLYLPLRALLLCGAFLALGLVARRLWGAPPGRFRARWGAAALGAGAVAWLLGSTSANVRFVAAEQAPATALLLAALSPIDPAPVQGRARLLHVRRSSTREVPGAPRAGHLVLITVDALRADRGGAPTPHLDALFGQLRFTRAYAQAPHTAHSIASLLTSSYPRRLPQSPAAPTLADILGAQRWFTQAYYPAGLFFDGRAALDAYARNRFGFSWADTRTLEAAALTDAVLLRVGQLARDGEPRAFLWVHYFDPHEPYEVHPGLNLGPSGTAGGGEPEQPSQASRGRTRSGPC